MPIYPYEKSGKEFYFYQFEYKKPDGKRRIVKRKGFKGKKEAREAERAARVEFEKGNFVEPNKLTYEQFVLDWFNNKTDMNEGTRTTNSGILKNHILPVLGHLPLQKITVRDIERFISILAKKNLADGTKKKIFNLAQTSFGSAYRKELIVKDPFTLLENHAKPRVTKPKIDYWTREEVETFFERLGPDYHRRAFFIVAIYTGMRRGELLGLRWRDIDFVNKRLHVRQIVSKGKIEARVKTSSGYRSVSMSETVKKELKAHRKKVLTQKLKAKDYNDQDLVFAQPDGSPYSDGNFTKFWNRIIQKTEMRRIRFHDLRHTCASLLLSANVHPKVVQEMLGHSSIKITLDTYSHLLPNMQDEAASTMDKLLENVSRDTL